MSKIFIKFSSFLATVQQFWREEYKERLAEFRFRKSWIEDDFQKRFCFFSVDTCGNDARTIFESSNLFQCFSGWFLSVTYTCVVDGRIVYFTNPSTQAPRQEEEEKQLLSSFHLSLLIFQQVFFKNNVLFQLTSYLKKNRSHNLLEGEYRIGVLGVLIE